MELSRTETRFVHRLVIRHANNAPTRIVLLRVSRKSIIPEAIPCLRNES
jgi:hypothetical protein